MERDVINLASETVGTVDLDDAIFAVAVRPDILARTVNWQLAKRRAGTHKTKLRGEVARSTKKPFKQKGTGRARQGSAKGPHMRGGAVVFGPLPRDHATDLTEKGAPAGAQVRACRRSSPTATLIVLDKAELAEPKTKVLAACVEKLGWQKALVIDGAAVETNFAKAAQNLVGVDVLPTQGANVYDILRHGTVVVTRAALETLKERLA